MAALAPRVYESYAKTVAYNDGLDTKQADALRTTYINTATNMQTDLGKEFAKSSTELNDYTAKYNVIAQLAHHYGLDDPNKLPTANQLTAAYTTSINLQNKGYPALLTEDDMTQFRTQMQAQQNAVGNYQTSNSEFERGILNQFGIDGNTLDINTGAGMGAPGTQTLTPAQQLIDAQVKATGVSGGNSYKESFLQNRLVDTANGLDPKARNDWLDVINAPKAVSIGEQIAALQAARQQWAGVGSYKGVADSGGALDYVAGQADTKIAAIDAQIADLQSRAGIGGVARAEDPLAIALRSGTNGWITDYYKQTAAKRGLYTGQFAPATQWK
jgi:hypothetical protein